MRSKRQQEQDHHSRSPKRLQVETSPIRLNDVIDTESPRNGTSVGDELSRDESIQVPIQEPATLHGRSPEDASPTDSVVCYGMVGSLLVGYAYTLMLSLTCLQAARSRSSVEMAT